MNYRRLNNLIPFAGTFSATFGGKDWSLTIYDYERENDYEDCLCFNFDERNKEFIKTYGHLIVTNSALHELAKGKVIKVRTTHGFSGKIIRLHKNFEPEN